LRERRGADQENYPMRKIFLLFMPPNNPEAMLHYQETIQRPVSLDSVCSFVCHPPAVFLEKIRGT
jgi:hypothetical protein